MDNMSYLSLQFEESEIFPKKIVAVRPDVHMMFSAGTLSKQIARETRTTSPIFELSYSRKNTLHGEVEHRSVELHTGYTSLGFLGEVVGHSKYDPGEEVKLYSVWVSPCAFNGFCEAVTNESNVSFDSFRQGSYNQYNFKNDPQEENLKNKLEFLFTNESDRLNRLLVESYLLELLEINIEHLLGINQKQKGLSKTDMEQMIYAREILLDRLDSPPSLFELSRILHMNDCKLKRTFKQYFGNTVYGFIRENRLEKAFSLLEQGNCNVSEAAFAVGYTNTSHFSESFKKKFGILPSSMI